MQLFVGFDLGFFLVWFFFFIRVRISVTKRKKTQQNTTTLVYHFQSPPIDFPYRNYLLLSLFDQTNLTHTYFSNDIESWELLATKRKLQGKTENFLERTILHSVPFVYYFCQSSV